VDHLSTIGELEETVLVFTSDNGLFFGEHAIAAGKSLPYEPAVRVPLIIAGPGVDPAQRGTTSDLPVANVDLGATILDLADTAPLAPLDGRSLVPLLAGDAASWEARHPRPVYLMGIGRTELDPGRPTFSGVRTGDGWVYLRWETSPPAVELYDLRTDPHQLENLAGDPSLQVLQARLERQRQLLVRCAGRSCDVPPFGFLDLPGATVPPWFGPARWAEEAGVEVAFPDGTFRPSGRPARGTTIGWLWREAGSPVAAPSAVADVPPSLQSAADWAVEAGVLSAATTDLRPQLVTSRSTWASWLWRRAGRPPGRSAGLPSDVPARHRTRPEVAWLYTDPDGSGPLRAPGGTVPARFLPDTPVTRATAVTWLRRAAAQFD
ncbi:MAG TPA: sulfatase/phosphatase domain-containing protein, partial [Acidimicrobiales bacterium]|nr:sulfatase/phosphatase domain-containing protein [Acidimicrobiales bacterium]